jgi:hypothetical protein
VSSHGGDTASAMARRPADLGTCCTWRVGAIVGRPRCLRRTITIALVVGTILFAINELDIILHGDVDAVGWIKAAGTYVASHVCRPRRVSSAGPLVGTHHRSQPMTDRSVTATSVVHSLRRRRKRPASGDVYGDDLTTRPWTAWDVRCAAPRWCGTSQALLTFTWDVPGVAPAGVPSDISAPCAEIAAQCNPARERPGELGGDVTVASSSCGGATTGGPSVAQVAATRG